MSHENVASIERTIDRRSHNRFEPIRFRLARASSKSSSDHSAATENGADSHLGDLGNGRFVVLLGEVRHQVSQLREYDVAEA